MSNELTVNVIKVYDVFGKLVLQEKTQFKQLDFTGLNQGVYLVIIETNTHRITRKIIKK